jgi:hypothetical protein
MSAPKVDKCYCGCDKPTKGYFASEGGHDAKAASMLHFVTWGTSDVAAILHDLGYGPDGENLEAKASAAGWKSKAEG